MQNQLNNQGDNNTKCLLPFCRHKQQEIIPEEQKFFELNKNFFLPYAAKIEIVTEEGNNVDVYFPRPPYANLIDSVCIFIYIYKIIKSMLLFYLPIFILEFDNHFLMNL